MFFAIDINMWIPTCPIGSSGRYSSSLAARRCLATNESEHLQGFGFSAMVGRHRPPLVAPN